MHGGAGAAAAEGEFCLARKPCCSTGACPVASVDLPQLYTASILFLLLHVSLYTAGEMEAISLSSFLGDMFEIDAQRELTNMIRMICPFSADISPIISRKAESGRRAPASSTRDLRQIDLVAYLGGVDAMGQPCRSFVADGVSLIFPRGVDAVVEPALPALAALGGGHESRRRFSDADSSRDMPQKYFVAEAYSGIKHHKQLAKLAELDTLLTFLFSRWQEKHSSHAPADITEVVGAAALVFAAPARMRTALLEEVLPALREALVSGSRPSALRLAKAGRLLLVILDTSQQVFTERERNVAKVITGKAYFKDI